MLDGLERSLERDSTSIDEEKHVQDTWERKRETVYTGDLKMSLAAFHRRICEAVARERRSGMLFRGDRGSFSTP